MFIADKKPLYLLFLAIKSERYVQNIFRKIGFN